MQDHGIDHLRYEFAGSCDHATTASAPPRRTRRPARPTQRHLSGAVPSRAAVSADRAAMRSQRTGGTLSGRTAASAGRVVGPRSRHITW